MTFLREKIEIGLEEAELKAQNTFFGFSRGTKRYIIVLLAAALPAFFAVKFASEKIWLKKDASQTFAAKESFSNPTSPQISTVSFVKTGEGAYAAAVQIKVSPKMFQRRIPEYEPPVTGRTVISLKNMPDVAPFY